MQITGKKVITRCIGQRDANHWEKCDHSGARFDLCTVYGHIHQPEEADQPEEAIVQENEIVITDRVLLESFSRYRSNKPKL